MRWNTSGVVDKQGIAVKYGTPISEISEILEISENLIYDTHPTPLLLEGVKLGFAISFSVRFSPLGVLAKVSTPAVHYQG